MIIAVIHANQAVAKRKPEKNLALNGIRIHDLCDTGAVLYQLSYQANWELVVGSSRRGHGFESRSRLNFFQALFSQLLNVVNCDDHLLIQTWIYRKESVFRVIRHFCFSSSHFRNLIVCRHLVSCS